MAIGTSDAARVLSRAAVDEHGCVVWQGTTEDNPYGRIHVGRKVQYAHRVVWEAFVGPIPEGLQIDHLCKNKACANVEHLEVVDSWTNSMRAGTWDYQRNKTHCPQGHEYSHTVCVKRYIKRRCRTCQNETNRRNRAKRKAS